MVPGRSGTLCGGKVRMLPPLGRFALQIVCPLPPSRQVNPPARLRATHACMRKRGATDALEQVIWPRKTMGNKDLVHHSDRPSHGLKTNRCRATGSQYLSIKYTERLAPSRDIASQCPAGQRNPRSISRSEPSATPTTMRWPSASSIRALTRPHWGHCRPQIFKTEVLLSD